MGGGVLCLKLFVIGCWLLDARCLLLVVCWLVVGWLVFDGVCWSLMVARWALFVVFGIMRVACFLLLGPMVDVGCCLLLVGCWLCFVGCW